MFRFRLRSALERPLHAFERSYAWPVWMGFNFLALLAVAAWFRQPSDGGVHRAAAQIVNQGIRGAAIIATADWALRRVKRLAPLRRTAVGLAPFAALPPMKSALPLLALIAVGMDRRRESSLVFASGRHDLIRASRLPSWRRFPEWLDRERTGAPWWRQWRVPRGAVRARPTATVGGRRRRRLAAAQSGLEYFELAGLGIALAQLGRTVPGLASFLARSAALVLSLAVIAGAAGSLVSGIRRRLAGLDARSPAWPFGTLFAGASAGLGGLFAGQAGGTTLVQVTGAFLLVASAISFVQNPFLFGGGAWGPVWWIGCYFLLAVSALALVRAAPLVTGLSPYLELAAVVSPLLGGVMGCLKAGQVGIQPTGPFGARASRVAALLVLASPLGGLAAPWWLRHSASDLHRTSVP